MQSNEETHIKIQTVTNKFHSKDLNHLCQMNKIYIINIYPDIYQLVFSTANMKDFI